jgi:uncharacterized phage-associated protein
MLKTHEREKLINAIVFFAKNTKYCGKIKLIKLLYFLDFNHFAQTGRSVTGLDYRAWKMGPVPTTFYQEWDEPGDDLTAAVDILPTKIIDHTREEVVAKKEFDNSHFTKRELRIMEELASRHRDDYAKQMVNATHAGGPWSKIWDEGRGDGDRIPYNLAIADDDPHRDAILEAAAEYANVRMTLGVIP